MEFPAFGAEAGGMEFPAFDAVPGEDGLVFPAFEAAPGEEQDELAGLDEGPLFPAFEAAPEAPADPAALTFAEEPLEFMPDDEGPFFPPMADEPVFPAFEALAAGAAPAAEPTPVFPPFAAEPPAAPPVVESPAAAVAPHVDPEQTLRYKEVPATSQPAPSPLPALDAAALAGLTGKEVVIKTPDDRRVANQQLTQVVQALSTGLDEVQGRMAHLYSDLQGAAVSRAPVEEIQRITTELAMAKSSVSEGSDLYKQALYMRQMAVAYLQMLREL